MTQFGDSKHLLDRAERHFQEFSDASSQVYSFEQTKIDDKTANHVLTLDRDAIQALKPIIADLANNVRHGLDLLASTSARQNLGSDKARDARLNIRFPFPSDDGTLEKGIQKQSSFLHPNHIFCIQEVWKKHSTYEYYLRVIRDISNRSKHWELEFPKSEVLHVQVYLPDGSFVGQPIPANHFDENETFEWEGPIGSSYQFLFKQTLSDFQPRPDAYPQPPSADSVFRRGLCYAEEMLEAFESASS